MSTIPMVGSILAVPPTTSARTWPIRWVTAQAQSILPQRLALQLGRAFWLVCLLFSVYVFISTNPSRFRQMQDAFFINSAAFGELGIGRGFLPPYILILDSLNFIVFVVVGVLIFWRKSSDWVALFGSIALVTAGITTSRPADSLFFVQPELRTPILLLFTLGTGSILFFLYLFPGGHFTRRWMIFLALATSGLPVVASVKQILSLSTSAWPPPVVAPTAIPAVVLAVVVQAYRYKRQASLAERQQTKWVLYGLAVAAAGFTGFLLVVPWMFPRVHQPGIEDAIYMLVGIPLFYLSLMLLPLSIGASILRFRLWDIDLIIRQSILYGTLTAVVAGIFASAITFGQRTFLSVTRQESDVAAVLATLLVVSLITPLRDTLQKCVDRRLKTAHQPAARLQAYVDRVSTRVSPVEPIRISRGLAEEMVAAFDATGAGIYWDNGGKLKCIYRMGEWNEDASASASLQASEHSKRLGVIALGARRNGCTYSEEDQKVLQQAASVVSMAIEQDTMQAQAS